MRGINRPTLPNLPRTASEVPDSALRGRRDECETLERLVASVRAGQSAVLVLRGEAGTGKTALLNFLARHAAACRIVRIAGAEAEAGMAFAGLHQLCASFVDRLGRLPAPQDEALQTALRMRAGNAPDRFALSLATVGLLSQLSAERPVICLVDDAQWLDQASVQILAFAARHLADEPVAVVFAVRRPDGRPDLAGLPELRLGGLADGDARALLDSVMVGPLDARVRDRIAAETRGNPAALLEVQRWLAPADLAGGFMLPSAIPVPCRIAEDCRRRLAPLPSATRMLLLVAAAELVGDPVPVWRAAAHLGLETTAAEPATAAGLIEFNGRVRFCHSYGRAAVYQAASPQQRESVHRALAGATDPNVNPDQRAWHRAHAGTGLDEDIAAELDRSVYWARARGGLAAAAAFRERAAELTPEPPRRASRALDAAHAKRDAGAPDAALRLLAMARVGPLDHLGHARAELLHARLTAGPDRSLRLLKAAELLEPLNGGLAREACRDAFCAALAAGRLAFPGRVRQVAEAAYVGPSAPREPGAADSLLDALAVLVMEGHAAGIPLLKQALSAARGEEAPVQDALGWLPFAGRMSQVAWDAESWSALSSRLVSLAREAGALPALSAALAEGVALGLISGELALAAAMAEESETVARVTGNPTVSCGQALVAAWRGREAETRQLLAAAGPGIAACGEGQWLSAASWATAVLHNGLGRYDEALAAAEQGGAHPDELGFATWSLAELIEAAARTGSPERASGALRRLSDVTSAAATDWALGIAARSRALLSDGEPAEELYLEAIERLSRTRLRAELARAHLLYGEWLRRQRRRNTACEQLRAAYQMLTEMGAAAFAERARRELAAGGENVRKRTIETAAELTAQEAQIAWLASNGHSNAEISGQLFISSRTVEWHLRKVFSKLGISSRKELSAALPDLGRLPLPA
jgi:DNA-binding CsgD family transcriptional regulator